MSLGKSTSIDYASITSVLADRMRSGAPLSYDRGCERMQAVVMRHLECTKARARHIVSSLVARGFVRFGRHPHFQSLDVGRWTYHPPGEADAALSA